MSTDAVTLFLALLAIVAQALVAGLLLSSSVRAAVRPYASPLGFAVALVATAGSLYLSEVAHFPPCQLCWYQRIAMYPLVVVLGVAVLRRDPGGWRYALPLALLGLPVSAYHVLVERFPQLETNACDPANPCSLIWVERFGYLTIPAMAACGFALVATLGLIGERS